MYQEVTQFSHGPHPHFIQKEDEIGHYTASELWGHMVFYVNIAIMGNVQSCFSIICIHVPCRTFSQLCATIMLKPPSLF